VVIVAFHVGILFALGLPAWFLFSIWNGRKIGLNWVSEDSRAMYVDALKMVAASGSIAASLVSAIVSTSSNPTGVGVFPAQVAVTSLIVSIVGSVVTVILLSRTYELAQSRLRNFVREQQAKGIGIDLHTNQGQLSEADTWYGICITPTNGTIRFGMAFECKWELDPVMEARLETKFDAQYARHRSSLAGKIPKIGRNEPCPCESNRKYKKCYGRF
jgi:hypothetical protein